MAQVFFLNLNCVEFYFFIKKIIITRTYIETFSIADDVAIAKKSRFFKVFQFCFVFFLFYLFNELWSEIKNIVKQCQERHGGNKPRSVAETYLPVSLTSITCEIMEHVI